MSSHNFKKMFEFLKEKHGLFQQYQSYEDYCHQTEPAQEGNNLSESIKNQEIKNEIPPKEEDFKSTLNESDRKRFEQMFE